METEKPFLTSAPFACGLGWMANSLIALNYKVTSLLYKDRQWVNLPGGEKGLADDVKDHLLNHLPWMIENKSINFRASSEILWEHRLSFEGNSPVVLVLRDPRDAIYSLYRRWDSAGVIPMSYEEFLKHGGEWPDHFPGLFYLNPVNTYLFFNLLWLKQGNWRPVLAVKFEDIKRDPRTVLKTALQFLKLDNVSDTEIERAVSSSDTQKAAQLIASNLNKSSNMNAISKGVPYEWKTTHSGVWLSFFSNPKSELAIQYLGYETGTKHDLSSVQSLISPKYETLRRRLMWKAISFVSENTLKGWYIRLGLNPNRFLVRLRSLVGRVYLARLWTSRIPQLSNNHWKVSNFLFGAIGLFLSPKEIAYSIEHS